MSWFKRNAVALGALVVLIPATVVVVGGYEWWDYFQGRPVIAIEPEASGEAVTLHGAEFGPAVGVLGDPRTYDAPAETQVLAVTLPVQPGEIGPSCLTPTLREAATGREWNEASVRLTTPAMLMTSCQGKEMTDAYKMELHYLVPDSAEAPFTLELSIAEALPEFARIPVQLTQ